jgi:hypothetical protein
MAQDYNKTARFDIPSSHRQQEEIGQTFNSKISNLQPTQNTNRGGYRSIKTIAKPVRISGFEGYKTNYLSSRLRAMNLQSNACTATATVIPKRIEPIIMPQDVVIDLPRTDNVKPKRKTSFNDW